MEKIWKFARAAASDAIYVVVVALETNETSRDFY